MPLELVIISVSRRGDGVSLIGYGAVVPGQYGFVRLVAPTPNGILYPDQHRIGEIAEPRPYDLLRVEAPWADSRPTQPENRVVDDSEWTLLERPASRPHLLRLERTAVSRGPLFGTTARAVLVTRVSQTESILYIEPQDVEAICGWDGSKERYRTRLRFTNGGDLYDLPLTDRHYSQVLLRRGEGVYSLNELGCRAPSGLRLVVTLGEPFHGWCYKMVAGVLPRRTATLFRDAATPPFFTQDRNAFDDALESPRAFVAGA